MTEYYTEHFSGVVVWRIHRGVVTILIVPTRFKGTMQIKIPGGKNEPEELPIQTAWRELREETGLSPGPLSGEMTELEAARFRTPGGAHTRYFFLVDLDELVGTIRTTPYGDPQKDKVLFPPEWATARDLLRGDPEQQIFENHRSALEVALAHLSEARLDVAHAVFDLI
ncbi:MAG: NUDIX domain-containing protein [Candidatus Paceibacterota bacterium]